MKCLQWQKLFVSPFIYLQSVYYACYNNQSHESNRLQKNQAKEYLLYKVLNMPLDITENYLYEPHRLDELLNPGLAD